MNRLILFLAFVFSTLHTHAQISNSINSDTIIYNKVEEFPIFITPEKDYYYPELNKYLATKVKFPQHRIGCQGLILASLTIEKDGSVGNVYLKKGICKLFDDEVSKVAKTMKLWRPALIDCKPVRMEIIIPYGVKY